MTIASFNIAITDNDILEINETFELVINVSSLPSDVTVGIPAKVTVIIVDDDGKYIKIYVYVYVVYIHAT